MHEESLRQLAEEFLAGALSPTEFFAQLNQTTTASLPEATLDLDRQRRCGYPEVVYGEGKPTEMLAAIFHALLERGIDVLATRVDAAKGAALQGEFAAARYNAVARTFRIDVTPGGRPRLPGRVAVVTAGASDMPVGEEAAETLDWMGAEVLNIRDVGVAGPQRLTVRVPELRTCDAIVVVAGMEGALPSVVAGHVACPIIGVPTSCGYGANFGGVSALLSMLNSCAANVAVVNIDAGFKGAYLAGMIAARARRELP